MSSTPRKKVSKLIVLLGSISALALLIVVFTQLVVAREDDSNRQRRRSDRGDNPKIQLGESPPDFELPVLTLDTDNTGKPFGRIDDNNTIRLSSYYGKKPVCMIMSSYT
ncbi:hypothetical protein ACFL1G_05495 [Planctomycetota bacterium]